MSTNNTKQTHRIVQVAVQAHLRQILDYLIPQDWDINVLQPGLRIRVPFGKQKRIGIVMGTSANSDHPNDKLKYADAYFETTPLLLPDILRLAHWASQYYCYPIGEVMTSILPRLLRTEESIHIDNYAPRRRQKPSPIATQQPHALNAEQQHAVAQIMAHHTEFHVFLLEGVTGSGKTEVYCHCINALLSSNKQILILVPEIGLTPQTVQRFACRFDVPIAILHSRLSERERCHAWLQAQAGIAKIIIGTRSAIFTPLPNLGLIIIDESHDLSFKQQDHFRYSARDVAVMRGHIEQVPVILGSATPSFESLVNVQQQRYQHVLLTQRAGAAQQPHYHIIDIRNQKLQDNLSAELISNMQTHLQQGNQILVFLNRRGYAPVLICHACGWIANCQHCDAKMTLHWSPKKLHCHHCDSIRAWDKACPQCQSTQLLPIGTGTERVEHYLKEKFPDKSIVRIDRDSIKRKHAMQTLLHEIDQGQHHILVGTQMLAKGHHFPNVTLVAIIDADAGFFSADFRALERMAQLLTQVAGRAGRAEKPGHVFLQTRNPHHPLLQSLIQHGYRHFSKEAIQERQIAQLPPYSHLALLRAEAKESTQPQQFLNQIHKHINTLRLPHVKILGPIAAPMEKRAGRFRAHLIFQATQRKPLHHLLQQLMPILSKKHSTTVRWSLDVDPQEIF